MTQISFISSFTGTFLPSVLQQRIYNYTKVSKTSRPVWSACAKSNNGNKGSFRFYPFDNNNNEQPPFEPFDGSLPLLPQWQPQSLEADFEYNAKRISSRERVVEEQTKEHIVKIESPGHGTLFAKVVQNINKNDENKYWLRPLLLNHEDSTSIDLRGGSDIFVKKDKVIDLDNETKTRVIINLAATESDVLERAISDEQWNVFGAEALLKFLNTL